MRLHTKLLSLALLFNLAGSAFAHAQEEAVSKAAPAPPGALVLFPTRTIQAASFGDGCWVHMFDGTQYRGQQLTLVGPVGLPDMSRTGTPWRDWDSIIVGPHATVTIYIVADYGLPAATFKSNQRVADLTAITGRFEDINSVEVKCEAKPNAEAR